MLFLLPFSSEGTFLPPPCCLRPLPRGLEVGITHAHAHTRTNTRRQSWVSVPLAPPAPLAFSFKVSMPATHTHAHEAAQTLAELGFTKLVCYFFSDGTLPSLPAGNDS